MSRVLRKKNSNRYFSKKLFLILFCLVLFCLYLDEILAVSPVSVHVLLRSQTSQTGDGFFSPSDTLTA